MPGLGPLDQPSGLVGGGIVQVTANGTSANRCRVDDWFRTPGQLEVLVLCQNLAGAVADSRFTLLYQSDETTRALHTGYAWVTSDGSAPMPWQANSSSPTALNTVTHTAGSGLYTVLFPGLTAAVGNAQVTGQGTGSTYCKLRGVSVVAAGAQVVVACHTETGTLTDAAFNISYVAGGFAHNHGGAYGLANQSTRTTWYTLGNSFSSRDLPQARRAPNPSSPTTFLTGVYEVRMVFQASTGGNPIVTALGNNGNTCQVESWSMVGSDAVARVACRTPTGTAVNSQFSFLYSTRHD